MIDSDTAKQLSHDRQSCLMELRELREQREINQDDISFLMGTVNQTINLEVYCRAIETVLRFNKYKELI